MYSERFYRTWISPGGLRRFRVIRNESDMSIRAERDLSTEACGHLARVRSDIEAYIARHRSFGDSLVPVDVDRDAPQVVKVMAAASSKWGVGPMAAVAGAVAEAVGRELSALSATLIVENGGDIYLRGREPMNCALYAGDDSPFSGRAGFTLHAPEGAGVCTSSGVVGHSLSFGRAGAVTVIADDCAEADAAATAIANRISHPQDLHVQLEALDLDDGIRGVVACCGRLLASRGVRLFRMDHPGEVPS